MTRGSIAGLLMASLLVVLVLGRIYLPYFLEHRINARIAAMADYQGQVEDVDVHLYKGEYRIKGISIHQTGDDIEVPFLEIPELHLSVEWGALLDGALVGEILMLNPSANFAVDAQGRKQTGAGQDWTQPLKELMPIRINRFEVLNGKVTYQDFGTDPPLLLIFSQFQLEVLNIRNVDAEPGTLPSSINFSGQFADGTLSLNADANLLKDIPDFDLNSELENVSLPQLNDLAEAYAGLDFENGIFNLYVEMAVADGILEGYLKPVITDLEVLSLDNDSGGPLELAWEALVALFTNIFENQPQDQFASTVPLQGDINNIEIGYLSALVSILSNAFVNALAAATNDTISLDDVVGQDNSESANSTEGEQTDSADPNRSSVEPNGSPVE